MPTVLLVTNAFPPQAGNQAIHMAKRVKFLHQNGWQTVVLAPALTDDEVRDDSLLSELPEVTVHRTPFLFSRRMPSMRGGRGLFLTGKRRSLLDVLYLPTGYVRWAPGAILKGRRAARKSDVILTVNNPTMPHLIGYILKRLTHKPWVCEMRDPIAGYRFSRRGPELFNATVERIVATKATRVFQWGDYVIEPLAAQYPGEPQERFSVIPYGGYDPDDYRDLDATPPLENRPIVISHTGTFQAGIASPEFLLRAFGDLVDKGQMKPSDIRLNFAGEWRGEFQQLADNLGIEESIHAPGHIDRLECIRMWNESHVLLIVWAELDHVDRFPSKFWEYLGARRFIFALAPPAGKMARLIQEQNLGLVASPDDVDAITAALLEIRARHDAGNLQPRPADSFMEQMKRVSGEARVAEILDSAIRADSQ